MKRSCDICGKDFMPRRSDSKCCCNRCKNLKKIRDFRKTKPENYILFKNN